MSTPDSFNSPANKDFSITYYIASGFVLLCVTPFLLWFTTNIQQTFGHTVDTIRWTYLSITQVFGTLYQWYTLWQELRQLQPTGQWHMNGNTDHWLPQMLPPTDKCITEIWQQWTPTPFKYHITISKDLPQEHQVNTAELSFDLHFPNITQQWINTPLVVHNDCTLKEFIQGEERCLKFINQALTFFTFTNVSHTTTSLKEPMHINLPTCTANKHPSIENTTLSCTQSEKPALGFTPAKVHWAESNPTLTVPQILEIELCRQYTETLLKMLDGLYVTQPCHLYKRHRSWPKSFARKK